MPKSFTPHEALIHLMVTVSVADRAMTDIELEAIGHLVDKAPVFEGFDRKDLPAVATRTAELLRGTDGIDQILAAAKAALPERLLETAYALVVEVAAADTVAEQEELRFLEEMRDAFNLDPLVTAAIERSARVRYRRL